MLCTFKSTKHRSGVWQAHNHSTLLTMLFGTAYKMWFHTSSCPYPPPPCPRKKAFYYFQIRRQNISESMKKASPATLINFCHLYIVLLNRLFLVGIIKSIILRIVRRGGTLLRSFSVVWKGCHFSNSFYFLFIK